jgi:hypothetical protein
MKSFIAQDDTHISPSLCTNDAVYRISIENPETQAKHKDKKHFMAKMSNPCFCLSFYTEMLG